MSDLNYIRVNVREEFPSLWSEFGEYVTKNRIGIVGSNSFNNFLKQNQINGFAKFGEDIGHALIRKDHLIWLKLKY